MDNVNRLSTTISIDDPRESGLRPSGGLRPPLSSRRGRSRGMFQETVVELVMDCLFASPGISRVLLLMSFQVFFGCNLGNGCGYLLGDAGDVSLGWYGIGYRLSTADPRESGLRPSGGLRPPLSSRRGTFHDIVVELVVDCLFASPGISRVLLMLTFQVFIGCNLGNGCGYLLGDVGDVSLGWY